MPKIYFADNGLLHTLLQVQSENELLRHPMLGASWEGFVIATVINALGAAPEDAEAPGIEFEADRRPREPGTG